MLAASSSCVGAAAARDAMADELVERRAAEQPERETFRRRPVSRARLRAARAGARREVTRGSAWATSRSRALAEHCWTSQQWHCMRGTDC